MYKSKKTCQDFDSAIDKNNNNFKPSLLQTSDQYVQQYRPQIQSSLK